MPRKKHEYHFIYKTTNIINEKYYIGMHSTSNLNDGYIGSGKRLRRSINKYGKENFKIEILEFLSDRSSLKDREKELINEDSLKDPLCMNLKIGGEGGNLGKNGEYFGGDKWKGAQRYWSLPENKERLKKNLSIRSKKLWEDPEYRKTQSKIKPFLGKKHKPESIEKMKGHTRQTGEKNSQYGKKRTEETKEKIRKSLNLRFGKNIGSLNFQQERKIKRHINKEDEKIKFTINGIFYNKYRRNKILEIFSIDISTETEKNLNKVKTFLIKSYIDNYKSTTEIAKILKTNNETIRNYLILFNIPRRLKK